MGPPNTENIAPTASPIPQMLQEWLSSNKAIAQVERWVENIFNRWNGDNRRLEESLPNSLQQALLSLASRPFSPNPALLKSLLNTPPVRELIRKILSRALGDFARRATTSLAPAPVAQVAQGVGHWAKMAARTALSKAGALGEMVEAVSTEVERQAEKRAAEFVDAALERALEDLAQALASPAPHGPPLGRALLETALTWRLPQLARELANADLPGAAQSLQGPLAEWAGNAAFARLQGHLQTLSQNPAFAQWLRLWLEAAMET